MLEFVQILLIPMLRLLCIDVDGVLTSGLKTYNESGVCISKQFADHDWTAIKRFQAHDIPVVAITGDPWNEQILKNRNIPCIITRSTHKEDHLEKLCADYQCSPEEVAYVGDDLFDIGLLKQVGFPFVVWDGVEELFDIPSIHVLTSAGGYAVMDEMFRHFKKEKLIPDLSFEEEYKKILQLDARQKF